MRKIQMVDLTTQYEKIRGEINTEVQQVIDSTQFINGTPTKNFAKNLQDYLQVKHVIPCANGTDALQIALMANNLNESDEVITIPFTFVATVEVVALLKLKPIFIDVDPDTFNIDVDKIEEKITARTKAIIPVHLFGQSADMEKMMRIAEKNNLLVIEDTAQAIGCDYTFSDGRKQKAGTIGHIGTTSFYPTKNLGAYGDGGALVTNDDVLANKIKIICDHGSAKKYYYDSIGVNSRLDSMQAAILNVKLKYLNTYNEKRNAAASMYDERLKNMPGITIPKRNNNSTHVFHQYTIKVETGRDELKDFLQSKGIPSMIYYPVPLHLSAAYKIYGYNDGDFPVSEKIAGQVLSLPMHTELDEEQIDFICEAIKEFVGEHVIISGEII
ncbi:MAG: DegT/DnrJ/EryC1/StrS family aminotransferase [Fimbriimonadaceae bacterium]|nr:DegT/DnrJ/EryC1/StrS family aminotransferase [Chitinophagales bacterium]